MGTTIPPRTQGRGCWGGFRVPPGGAGGSGSPLSRGGGGAGSVPVAQQRGCGQLCPEPPCPAPIPWSLPHPLLPILGTPPAAPGAAFRGKLRHEERSSTLSPPHPPPHPPVGSAYPAPLFTPPTLAGTVPLCPAMPSPFPEGPSRPHAAPRGTPRTSSERQPRR